MDVKTGMHILALLKTSRSLSIDLDLKAGSVLAPHFTDVENEA